MPLYDHRVFKVQGEWWAAQVHGGSSVTTWGDMRVPPAIAYDSVYFTCLTDEKRNTQVASGDIPTGWLNLIDHASILRLLQSGRDFGSRLEMDPINVPDSGESPNRQPIVDADGLRWVVRKLPSNKEGAKPTLEVACLDDSALRRQILLQDDDTSDNLNAMTGHLGELALVESVKKTFLEFTPHPEDE